MTAVRKIFSDAYDLPKNRPRGPRHVPSGSIDGGNGWRFRGRRGGGS